MISVTKLIFFVLGLIVCSRTAQCQLIGYNLADDDLFQLNDNNDMGYAPGPMYEPSGLLQSPRPLDSPRDRARVVVDEILSELVDQAGDSGQQDDGLYFQSTESESSPSDRESFYEAISELRNQHRNQKRERPDNYFYYDVNSHLPATSLGKDTDDNSIAISGPVNDPEEFEAKLSQLTNALNHNMANTQDRQELLLGLLNRSGEFEAGSLREPINSVSSISQLDMDRLVGELDKMLDEQASEQQQRDDDEQQQQQQQQLQQQQQQQESSTSNLENLSRYGGSEYIDHPLALVGHQYVQGGAGEGRQLLGPDGTYENVQVVKTDTGIPSYCDPPNPCPIGYTAKDGCLENFVNSASFSREYQAQQKCSCDNEHSLFNCASPLSTTAGGVDRETTSSTAANAEISSNDIDGKLDTLARTIQNRYGDLASVKQLINKQRQQETSGQNPLVSAHDDSNYLVRSARKLSSLDMHHKVDLD